MSVEQSFGALLADLRPGLHRYCARMLGSAIEGEDVVQDVLVKAIDAHARNEPIENWRAWTLRVAHRRCLDLLRVRKHRPVVPLTEDLPDPAATMPPVDAAAVGFGVLAQLPVLQRCAVVLKDVLGHSIDEIAAIAGCTVPAAKSALQRGRSRLRILSRQPRPGGAERVLDEGERRRMMHFVDCFRRGDFDAIRGMLAQDVQLDLVARLHLQGRDRIAPYFSRYEEARRWSYGFGLVEGRPAMLVHEVASPDGPAHFVVLDWRDGRIAVIRDFLFAPYAMEGLDWAMAE